MSKSSGVKTIVVPWRKFCAALPAIALISTGVAFAAPIAPASDMVGVAVSRNSTAIVVPDTALTLPAAPAPTQFDPFGEASPTTPAPAGGSVPDGPAPALVLPPGTAPGGSAPVALDSTGIPLRAVQAYRAAATLVGAADPACHMDWALIAAIGRVESNHARFGGNQLDAAGIAQPGIIGIPLDGTNGTARITDTDQGQLDRDTVYDRAVGPMQFIPGTWRVAGADGDGDGVKNPQDMADAATATAIYLCSGPGDLSLPGDLRGAILRYNASDSYVRTVTSIADAYRQGVTVLPASDLPAAHTASSTNMAEAPPVPAARIPSALVPAPRVTPVPATHVKAKPSTPVAPIPATADAPVVTVIPPTPAPATEAPPTPVPATPVTPEPPVHTAPVPVTPVPATPVTPVPATPVPPTPKPCVPVSGPDDPTAATPTAAGPTAATPTPIDPTPIDPTPIDPATPAVCLPDPCLSTSSQTPDPSPSTPLLPVTCAVVPPDPKTTPTP